MLINLDYASQRRGSGLFVKPFCYAVDDSADGDGGAPVRDANYAQHLVEKFTSRLPGEFATTPPPPDYNPVFRIVLSVTNVRGKDALYAVLGYQRQDCSAVFNEVCRGYMELYAALRKITRAAKKRREAEKALRKKEREAKWQTKANRSIRTAEKRHG